MDASPATPGAVDWAATRRLLDALPTLPREQRTAAVEQLARLPVPTIRRRALRMGAVLMSLGEIEACVRDGADDVRRNMGLEMLKLRGVEAMEWAVAKLDDADDDVVLQAVLVLGTTGDARAAAALRQTLEHPNPNVVQGALIALGRVGHEAAVDDIVPFLGADPWLALAAIDALAQLGSRRAVPALAAQLAEPLYAREIVSTLGLIGGPAACDVLAARLTAEPQPDDISHVVTQLATVLEGLDSLPPCGTGLRLKLRAIMQRGSRSAHAAACALLALGGLDGVVNGKDDEQALSLLTEGTTEPLDGAPLPRCLLRRGDLAGALLERDGLPGHWGLELAARHPRETSPRVLAAAIRRNLNAQPLDLVVAALERQPPATVAELVIACLERLPGRSRATLASLVRRHRDAVASHLKSLRQAGTPVALDVALLLEVWLDLDPRHSRERLLACPSEERVRALEQIGTHCDLMRALPWQQWLTEQPDLYASLAARVACQVPLPELAPALRTTLAHYPHPELIRAVGVLRDALSVPLLVAHLAGAVGLSRALVLESLGRIGGSQARSVLRATALAPGSKDSRYAYRALAACAVEEDLPVFRQAARHRDWYVRLSALEVLARSQHPEDMARLAELATDPVETIADRAAEVLEC